jgi:hypothetical protein
MACKKCKEREVIDSSIMQRVIEEILVRQGISDIFLKSENWLVKIAPPKLGTLLIEKSGGRITILEDDIGEYSLSGLEPSGPEIEFEILDDGTWTVAALRERYRKKSKRAIEYIEGCRMIRPIRQKRQNKAAAAWAQALVIRKYVSGILRYSESW